MRPFAYERPADAAAAVAAMDGDGAMYLGGGTNLVDLMKLGVQAPARLVDEPATSRTSRAWSYGDSNRADQKSAYVSS
jgi:CO/xanthine dehydrogenase FAD-binding subunit